MGKSTMWFPNRSDTNRAKQALKMARGWKFWIQKEEKVTAKLICDFVFTYADRWFSYVVVHITF